MLPPTVVIRVEIDSEYAAKLRDALRQFCEDMLEHRAQLTARYGLPVPREEPPKPDGIGALGITDEDLEAIIRSRSPLGEQLGGTFVVDKLQENS